MGDMTPHFDWNDAFVSSRYPSLMRKARINATRTQKAMLFNTFNNVMEPIRDAFPDVPLRSLSAFRTMPIVNELIADGFSASRTSLHLIGGAVDFTTWRESQAHLLPMIFNFIKGELKNICGEVILYKVKGLPNRIHVGIKEFERELRVSVKEE
jgi:hypothetical protein